MLGLFQGRTCKEYMGGGGGVGHFGPTLYKNDFDVNKRGMPIRNLSEMCISIRSQAENHTVSENEFIFIEYIFYFL